MVSFREAGRKEELPGLVWKKELTPKLRSDVSHFAFSPDGRLLLAQDDFAITVIDREPRRCFFKSPSKTPTRPPSRRTESSSSSRPKPALRKMECRRAEAGRGARTRAASNCWEHELSPDGNYLACVDTSTTINVLDTRTGKKVWEKKEFYQLSIFEYISLARHGKRARTRGTSFFRIEFSPDSRFVMFSRSDKFIVSASSVDVETIAASENTALALDLSALKPVDVGGDLKKISSHAYIFLDSERVLGMPSRED